MNIKKSNTSFWNRFDYIAIICYTGYKDRIEELKPELERVGLLDKVHFHWDFPSPLRHRLSLSVGKTSFCSANNVFFMAAMHYNAVKLAQQLGVESILVLEDDVRFLKNVNLIRKIVESLPEDYDIAMMDRSKPSDMPIESFVEDAKSKPIARYWRSFSNASSTGMYALSKNGIDTYCRLVEDSITKEKMRHPDFWFRRFFQDNEVFGRDAKMYFAYPSVAVQGVCGKEGSHCNMSAYWEHNEAVGLKQEDYNMQSKVVTKNNFVSALYEAANRKGMQHPDESSVGLSVSGPNAFLHKCIFKNLTINPEIAKGVTVCNFVWGNGTSDGNINALTCSFRDNSPIILCEDGFIRSYATWVDQTVPNGLRQSHSVIYDTSAYYFDATRVSNLERMLNDKKIVVSERMKSEACRLIDKIVSLKISKYNHQPLVCPKIGRDGVRKVLVVDQSYGDFSIKRGLADESTFEKMLDAAIKENPDADILVKTHPDTMAGKKAEKKGYYQDLEAKGTIYKVTFPVNPYSLMELCDKVYVCSSQFGLEALMAGKEVHVFGMPFYAGWGLTIDDQRLARRTNKRTLEELFYIFYCIYTHWIDPEKKCETTIDAVIDKIVALRTTMEDPKQRRIIEREKAMERASLNGYRLGGGRTAKPVYKGPVSPMMTRAALMMR